MSSRIRIGCSGWHYKHWVGTYYPAGTPASRMFELYQKDFDTVEINNSFYRLPETKTFEMWRDQSSARFLYAVKASRFLTHQKKLNDPAEPLERMLSRASHLEKKLGPILFQLPPNWRINLDRLAGLLRLLPKDHQFTIEFRDKSWLCEETYALLRSYNVALCIYDLGGYTSPIEVTANFTYLRLHGPHEWKYEGNYSKGQLRKWAEWIDQWKQQRKRVYVYFDNDIGTAAPYDALLLKDLVE